MDGHLKGGATSSNKEEEDSKRKTDQNKIDGHLKGANETTGQEEQDKESNKNGTKEQLKDLEGSTSSSQHGEDKENKKRPESDLEESEKSKQTKTKKEEDAKEKDSEKQIDLESNQKEKEISSKEEQSDEPKRTKNKADQLQKYYNQKNNDDVEDKNEKNKKPSSPIEQEKKENKREHSSESEDKKQNKHAQNNEKIQKYYGLESENEKDREEGNKGDFKSDHLEKYYGTKQNNQDEQDRPSNKREEKPRPNEDEIIDNEKKELGVERSEDESSSDLDDIYSKKDKKSGYDFEVDDTRKDKKTPHYESDKIEQDDPQYTNDEETKSSDGYSSSSDDDKKNQDATLEGHDKKQSGGFDLDYKKLKAEFHGDIPPEAQEEIEKAQERKAKELNRPITEKEKEQIQESLITESEDVDHLKLINSNNITKEDSPTKNYKLSSLPEIIEITESYLNLMEESYDSIPELLYKEIKDKYKVESLIFIKYDQKKFSPSVVFSSQQEDETSKLIKNYMQKWEKTVRPSLGPISEFDSLNKCDYIFPFYDGARPLGLLVAIIKMNKDELDQEVELSEIEVILETSRGYFEALIEEAEKSKEKNSGVLSKLFNRNKKSA